MSPRNWPFGHLSPGSYGCILADNPHDFKTHTPKAAPSRKSAAWQYDLMSFNELAALPVRDLARKDCELVAWATQAGVFETIRLVERWGFTPKTMGAWGKRSTLGKSWHIGTGYVRRSTAEFYIIATIGQPKRASKGVRNFIDSPFQGHSVKPDDMHRQLEKIFPDVLRCELFARRKVAHWDCWGNGIAD